MGMAFRFKALIFIVISASMAEAEVGARARGTYSKLLPSQDFGQDHDGSKTAGGFSSFSSSPSSSSSSSSLDLNEVKKARPASGEVENFILRDLPEKLNSSGDRDQVGDELKKSVGERIGSDILSNDFFKKNAIGRILGSVEKVANKSFSLTQSKDQEVSAPGSPVTSVTKQAPSLDLQLLAYKAQAVLRYQGTFKSFLALGGRDRNVEFGLSKEVCRDTTVSLKEEIPLTAFTPSSNVNLSYTF